MRNILLTGWCLLVFSVSAQEVDSLQTISGDTVLIVSAEDTVALTGEKNDTVQSRIKFIHPYPFFMPSPVLNKPRVISTTSGIVSMYAIASIWFSKAWYADYPRSKFHLFNDAKEWQQMDKAGHVQAAYFLSRWGYNLYNWSGVKEKNAIWIGALWGNAWQLAIEMQDGFSEEWGFSMTDMAANLTGSLLFLGQQYLWHEQRMVLKISSWPVKYPEDQQERAAELYGTSFGEQILKDYNANTFWLSVSPGSFVKKPGSKFPKWIDVSLGYGSTGLLGGFENKWCAEDGKDASDCPPEQVVDRSDVERIREFYLSFDIDFTKIPTKSHALKTFLQIINIIKIPFPAMEVNTAGNVKWHWFKF